MISLPMPSLMGRMLEESADDLFADMPVLSTAPVQAQEAPKQQEDLLSGEEQGRFAYMRQVNALRMEMKKAVRQEDFERGGVAGPAASAGRAAPPAKRTKQGMKIIPKGRYRI